MRFSATLSDPVLQPTSSEVLSIKDSRGTLLHSLFLSVFVIGLIWHFFIFKIFGADVSKWGAPLKESPLSALLLITFVSIVIGFIFQVKNAVFGCSYLFDRAKGELSFNRRPILKLSEIQQLRLREKRDSDSHDRYFLMLVLPEGKEFRLLNTTDPLAAKNIAAEIEKYLGIKTETKPIKSSLSILGFQFLK